MMVLSRLWYIVLSLLLGMALYVVFLAVGQYNRRNGVAMTEELASDSQTVGWALQIDARKRLDALLLGAVDKGVQDALQGANGKDAIPAKVKDDGRHALAAVLEKIAVDFRPDALFAVDHDGRVVAEVGYDASNAFPDFELGGYPVVFDALHGYLRDDTWVLAGKLYRVVARPVEFDSTQPPLGAIVAMRMVDKKFAQDLSKKTRANIAFFAAGQRVVSSALDGFDENQLALVDNDLPKLAGDKEYGEGRSEVRFVNDDVGVMYARLFGDAWELGGGFVVARARVTIDGWLGFLNGADDKDKQSVNFLFIAAIVLGGILGGMFLSFLEQSLPMREMQRQGGRLRKGEIDYFQLPRFRGSYRAVAQDVNAGIERVLEKGGAAVRKPADLESILGPVPAQPAMSAFSFPLAESPPAPHRPPPPPLGGGPDSDVAHSNQGQYGTPSSGGGMSGAIAAGIAAGAASRGAPHAPPPKPAPAHSPPAHSPPAHSPQGAAPPIAPFQGPPIASMHTAGAGPGSAGTPQASAKVSPGGAFAFGDSPADGDGPTLAAPAAMRPPSQSESGARPVGFPPPAGKASPPQRAGAATMLGIGQQGQAAGGSAAMSPTTVPHDFVPPGSGSLGGAARPPAPSRPQVGSPAPVPAAPTSSSTLARQLQNLNDEAEDEATVVAPAPSELLAQAGAAKAPNDTAEWMTVYDDFVRTKKQCGEPTEGLTFEKFQATLKKNRDALMQRHNCKRVRFSVYVKEGRASLKATPVRD
jgi:hypothetical protein